MSNALVIGGGTGIGYATARRLVGRGVSVMLSGRREEKLREAKEGLDADADGAKVAYSAGDSSVEADAKRIVSETVDALGGIDICVNCAGTYEPADFLEMDETAWKQTIGPTLDAMLYPCVAAAKVMAEKGAGGRFVLISSINSPLSEPESAHYSAAKAAVSSLARSMAVDLAKHNILVNAIAPGWVATDMVGDFVENASPESLKQLNILARVGEPDEIGNVIEYLALDAPSYIDGATIFVDGGQTAMAPLI